MLNTRVPTHRYVVNVSDKPKKLHDRELPNGIITIEPLATATAPASIPINVFRRNWRTGGWLQPYSKAQETIVENVADEQALEEQAVVSEPVKVKSKPRAKAKHKPKSTIKDDEMSLDDAFWTGATHTINGKAIRLVTLGDRIVECADVNGDMLVIHRNTWNEKAEEI